MIGERVWDQMRLIDWALDLPEVAGDRMLMLGNSGGGMATLHAAACDEHIGVAVPWRAFDNYISPLGTIRHCPCNVVPGMLTFGEYWDVARLIARRSLLTVNGLKDRLHPVAEIDHAVSRLRTIYGIAGCGDHYEHRYGPEGHRFYGSMMWPWIENAKRADGDGAHPRPAKWTRRRLTPASQVRNRLDESNRRPPRHEGRVVIPHTAAHANKGAERHLG